MRRHDWKGNPVDKTVFFQVLKRLRQHLLAYTANLASQITEALRTVHQGHQHENSPATGDVLEDYSRWALNGKQLSAPHQFGQFCGFRIFHDTYLFVRTYF